MTRRERQPRSLHPAPDADTLRGDGDYLQTRSATGNPVGVQPLHVQLDPPPAAYPAHTRPPNTKAPHRHRNTGRPGGRHTDLTPQVAQTLVDAVANGHTFKAAAALAGIAERTIHAWRERGAAEPVPPGEKGHDPDWERFAQFVQRLDYARARAEDVLVAAAFAAARGGTLVKETTRRDPSDEGVEIVEQQFTAPDGRVALELLARRNPLEWARRQALDVTVGGPDGGAVQVEHSFADMASRVRAALAEEDEPLPVVSERVDELG